MNLQEDTKPSLDDALAHFGVKGMRWGVRKAAEPTGGGSSGPSRRELRTMDKQAKAKDRAARNAEIDAARERYATTARKNYLDARAQYKVEKKTIGKYEARKKLDAVKQKNLDDYEAAQQIKSGKETALYVLGVVGAVTVAHLAARA